MAAWFSVLYTIYDVVERLDADTDTVASKDSISILRAISIFPNCSPGLNGDAWEHVKHMTSTSRVYVRVLQPERICRRFFTAHCTTWEDMTMEAGVRHLAVPLPRVDEYLRILMMTI
ncbi:hypothetical protein MPH_11840 [Macrophomina phaseolina MS6]|uniref:Uncharacterized protein n=1 Tax=Macrophomina phaseolina (strain MS6) TaxID=1126212 RepID=K2RDX7_MACPH|nr:hypothetical protein MPH_11840 [Macrophomina phaseolina MS6]